MHLCPGKRVALGRPVVYYARADHTFSAEIKCRYCSSVVIVGVVIVELCITHMCESNFKRIIFNS